MKPYRMGVIAMIAFAVVAGPAEARNPHCAGGIQYVTQALQDREKGNKEDYQREIGKAVQQLEMCQAEDPNDYDGLGYLGWAYAEVDSAGPAGRAFKAAIDGLTAKGDKKAVDRWTTNRDHYWSLSFNDGIAKIQSAQTAYPDFCKTPAGPAEQKLKDEATKHYDAAVTSLTRASLMRPGDVRTLRNLGAIYASRCEFEKAETVFHDALQSAPGDTEMVGALRAVRVNHANALIEGKKYDDAIGLLGNLAQSSAGDANLQLSLADAHFKRAQNWSPDALPPGRSEALKRIAPAEAQLKQLQESLADSLRRADFRAAGDAYAKAAAVSGTNSDLPFNAALAYQNAGEVALAETQWKAALKLKPDDPDILSSLGSTLADENKYSEAIKILHQAVVANPKNKSLHRQLGAVYTKFGNAPKGTEELMVFLALQNGQAAADPAGTAKKAAAGSVAAKTFAAAGAPEQVNLWEAQSEKYESWFYWSKNQAYHFKAGTLVVKSDWTSADLKPAAGGSK